MITIKSMILGFVFLWFFIGSCAHFIYTNAEAGIIPGYIPYHTFDVYVSGVFEMLGALALWSKWLRRYAGIGLFVLTIAVTPANIYMAMHQARYPEIAPWILYFRLLFQVILLVMISWSSGMLVKLPPLPRTGSKKFRSGGGQNAPGR